MGPDAIERHKLLLFIIHFYIVLAGNFHSMCNGWLFISTYLASVPNIVDDTFELAIDGKQANITTNLNIWLVKEHRLISRI